MKAAPAEVRRTKLERAAAETFDLLVIGGGINGAAIGREAALRGLSTLVLDKGDFASGTSSRSSKLIHGGFRYLETGDFGLVFEASRERDLLRKRLAPHLVRPMRFFFPAYQGTPLGLGRLRVGLLLYDLLAAFRNIERHRIVRQGGATAEEPDLRVEGLRGGAFYFDCFTEDARLVIENVLGAEEAGAVCLNYVAVDGLEKSAGFLDGARLRDLDREGGTLTVRARAIVNAAGPWLDQIRALDDASSPPVLRPTKGVHLVLPRERVGNRNAVVLRAVRDGRILFVIPWRDHSIIGTTDTDHRGSPDEVAVEEEDVDYLLETANFYFPKAKLDEADVVSSFAGLRPLVASTTAEAPSMLSREEALFESTSGLVSIGGGKLTTYRRIAVKVVDRIARRLRERFGIVARASSGSAVLPLPGARGTGDSGPEDALCGVERALRCRYGSRAVEISATIAAVPGLGEALAPGVDEVKAEATFAAATELALRVEDVLRRRTSVALKSADRGQGAAATTAALIGRELGWSAATEALRAGEYVEAVAVPESRRRKRA